MKNLDQWWDVHSAGRRYDRGPMYFWMMVAAHLTSLSMIITGPVPGGSIAELGPDLQKTLAWVLFGGTFICIFAACTGSKYWFPDWTRTKSYSVALLGIPFVVSSMLFYTYAIAINTHNFTSALGGTFSPLLALGAVINGVYFWLEIRRIKRNVKMIREADAG